MSHSARGRQAEVCLVLERDGHDEPVIDRREPMTSWVDNWYLLHAVFAHDGASQDVTDISGSTRTIEMGRSASNVLIGSDTNAEIGIGTGTGGFDQSDNDLDNRLSKGQTNSGAVETSNQLVRSSAGFNFSSSQTITEVGFYIADVTDDTGSDFVMLIERTLLSSTVDVVNGDSLSVTYEWTWNSP